MQKFFPFEEKPLCFAGPNLQNNVFQWIIGASNFQTILPEAENTAKPSKQLFSMFWRWFQKLSKKCIVNDASPRSNLDTKLTSFSRRSYKNKNVPFSSWSWDCFKKKFTSNLKWYKCTDKSEYGLRWHCQAGQIWWGGREQIQIEGIFFVDLSYFSLSSLYLWQWKTKMSSHHNCLSL